MPSIVPSPDTVRVNIERSITLQCRAIGFPTPTVEWMRDGIPLRQLDNPRYTILADGNLMITSTIFG